jgi:NDP-sugar pyrophosphorylase family protein
MDNKHVTISAAGKGSRIREYMDNIGYNDLPKPLLKTGSGETLIGRIARQSQEVGDVMIYANYDTIRPIGESQDLPDDVYLLINRNIYGPLGPIYLDLFKNNKQAYMATGDMWSDFKWSEFIKFHNSHNKPVSILVGKSVPTKEGAIFHIDKNGFVKSWERVAHTTKGDLINIGAYIIDPDEKVMNNIRQLPSHKEDPFNDIMIADGLMAAYVADGTAYNVNNIEVYKALIEGTKD